MVERGSRGGGENSQIQSIFSRHQTERIFLRDWMLSVRERARDDPSVFCLGHWKDGVQIGRAEVVVQKLALNFLLGISTRWRGRWTRESGVRGSSGCTDGWRHLGGRKGGTSGGG